MTEETLLKLLKSTVDEDCIIGANWMIRNYTLEECLKFFKRYSTYKSVEDYEQYYICGSCIERPIEYDISRVCAVYGDDCMIFISNQLWFLDPAEHNCELKDVTI